MSGVPFQTRPENEAKRLRAYELYVSASTDGKRRSLRSIAQELGVTLGAIQYWRDQDNWERKIREAMLTASQSAELAASHVKMAFRKSLLEGLDQLHDILKNGNSRDKILAFKEIVNSSIRLRAVDFASGADQPLPEWEDEVDTNTTPTEEPASEPA